MPSCMALCPFGIFCFKLMINRKGTDCERILCWRSLSCIWWKCKRSLSKHTTLEHWSILCAWVPLNPCWHMSGTLDPSKHNWRNDWKCGFFRCLIAGPFLEGLFFPLHASIIHHALQRSLRVAMCCHCGWRLGDPPQSHTLGPVFPANIAMGSLNTDLHSAFCC